MALKRTTLAVEGQSVEHFYLCNYKPKSFIGHDRLSESLLRFKNGLNPDLCAWIECSVAELAKKFKGSGASIIRALGHSETIASQNTPLSLLCQRLVTDLGLIDACAALCKRHTSKKMSLLSKQDRYNETINNYFVNNHPLATNRILIIDDILTSGATINAIIKAIKIMKPISSIKVFTFAVCDRSAELNQMIAPDSYQFASLGPVESQFSDSAEEYYAYGELRGRILADDFES